jgi:hypothetical protein
VQKSGGIFFLKNLILVNISKDDWSKLKKPHYYAEKQALGVYCGSISSRRAFTHN